MPLKKYSRWHRGFFVAFLSFVSTFSAPIVDRLPLIMCLRYPLDNPYICRSRIAFGLSGNELIISNMTELLTEEIAHQSLHTLKYFGAILHLSR